jgi:cytochrome c
MTSLRTKALLVFLIVLTAGTASVRAADIKNGKVVFEKCAACHSLEAGKNDIGPSLAGVFGRKAASLEDFRYSTAMKQSNVTWDERTLDSFIEDPQAFIPGNRMPFDGLKDKQDRDDLLAYLKMATKNSDSAQLQSWLILQWAASKGTQDKNVGRCMRIMLGGSCPSQIRVRREAAGCNASASTVILPGLMLRVTAQETTRKLRGKSGIAVTTD